MLHVIMNFNNIGAETLVFCIFCNNRPQTLNIRHVSKLVQLDLLVCTVGIHFLLTLQCLTT